MTTPIHYDYLAKFRQRYPVLGKKTENIALVVILPQAMHHWEPRQYFFCFPKVQVTPCSYCCFFLLEVLFKNLLYVFFLCKR